MKIITRKFTYDEIKNDPDTQVSAELCSIFANVVYEDDRLKSKEDVSVESELTGGNKGDNRKGKKQEEGILQNNLEVIATKKDLDVSTWRAIDLKERKSPEPGTGGENQTEVNKAEVEKQIGGFRAASFMNKDTKEIVISYCGTNSPMDYPVDLALALHIPHWQEWQAERYYKAIAKKYPGYKITLTGHSLGGALVQHVGSKYGLRGITFNAPGIRKSKNAKQTEGKSNIVNYVNMNDPFGCSFKHIGEVRYYLPDGIVDGKYKPHSDYVGADFSKYKPIVFKDREGNVVDWGTRNALSIFKYDINNKNSVLKHGATAIDANAYTFQQTMELMFYSNINPLCIEGSHNYDVDGEESTIEVKDNKVVCSYPEKDYPIQEAIHKTVGGTVKGIQKGAEKTVNYLKKKTTKPKNSEEHEAGTATGGASKVEEVEVEAEKENKKEKEGETETRSKENTKRKEKAEQKEPRGKKSGSGGGNEKGHWITTKGGKHIFIEDGVPRIRYFCYSEPMPIINTEVKEQQSSPTVAKGRREPEVIYSFAPVGYESEKDPAFEEYLKGERDNHAKAYYSGPYDAAFEAYLRGE